MSGAISRGVAQSEASSASLPVDLPGGRFRLPPGFTIDVMAGEPLLTRPVAIDWGADGRLWVVELNEESAVASSPGEPTGRVVWLSDANRDGRYDQSVLFLDALPCPSSVLAWGKGALICAAPDLLYAEDTNADGRADIAQRLWIGFDAENPARRLNSLSLGFDNWVYGANGSRGGTVQALAHLNSTPVPPMTEVVAITSHDFRLKPDTGEFELASGLTASARTRDDWDNWFGCDAEGAVWQYPLPCCYRRRNPHVALPDDAVLLFRQRGSAGEPRQAVSFCLNRGGFLGMDYVGNGFLCEPERREVHRLTLTRSGITFRADDAAAHRTLLSSSDPAFEPVQVRIGPEGALWIVDRHRSLALSPATSTPVAGAGASQSAGRILRLRPEGSPTRAIPDLTRLPIAELVTALDTSNGVERDRAHAHLLHRRDPNTVSPLRQLARQSRRPECRAQALGVLEGLGGVSPQDLEAALQDPHPGVRAQAIRLSEPFLQRDDVSRPLVLGTALLRLIEDPEKTVRYQLTLTLGEWNDPRAGQGLGQMAAIEFTNAWFRAAVLSGASRFPEDILKAVLSVKSCPADAAGFIDSLAVTAANAKHDAVVGRFVARLNDPTLATNETLAMSGLARLLEALRDQPPERASTNFPAGWRLKQAAAGSTRLLQRARAFARDRSASEPARAAAVRLLGQAPEPPDDDLEFLSQLLVSSDSTRLKAMALDALVATRNPRVADLLLARWSRQPPSVRRAIIGPLVARPEWAERLLDAVNKGILATTEVTPVNRERLLTDPGIRDQAGAVLAARLPDRRREVVAQFAPALSLTGNPAKGRVTFENNCSRCHALGGRGFAVGPDLSALGSRTTSELLESILDPTATIEPRFVNYQIETEDERSLSGIVTTEDGARLTLVQPGGKEESVALKEITDLRASNLSLMPEGLEQGQSAPDLADLLAFIRSQGR